MWFGFVEGWCTGIEGWCVGRNPPYARFAVFRLDSKYRLFYLGVSPHIGHSISTFRCPKTDVKDSPRFMKAFSYHLPYGLKQVYREEIEHLTLQKLGHLIRICGFLMQTKVYLFWGRMAN